MNTETQLPRLIDANALLEVLNIARKDRPDSQDDLSDYGFWIMERIIMSEKTYSSPEQIVFYLNKIYGDKIDFKEFEEAKWIETAIRIINSQFM